MDETLRQLQQCSSLHLNFLDRQHAGQVPVAGGQLLLLVLLESDQDETYLHLDALSEFLTLAVMEIRAAQSRELCSDISGQPESQAVMSASSRST